MRNSHMVLKRNAAASDQNKPSQTGSIALNLNFPSDAHIITVIQLKIQRFSAS